MTDVLTSFFDCTHLRHSRSCRKKLKSGVYDKEKWQLLSDVKSLFALSEENSLKQLKTS